MQVYCPYCEDYTNIYEECLAIISSLITNIDEENESLEKHTFDTKHYYPVAYKCTECHNSIINTDRRPIICKQFLDWVKRYGYINN
ncbi:MAG: hypothetical protein ACOC80_10185 [Petrotogales bacterium]